MNQLKSIEKNGIKVTMIKKNDTYFLVKRDGSGNEITSLPFKTFEQADEGFNRILETL